MPPVSATRSLAAGDLGASGQRRHRGPGVEAEDRRGSDLGSGHQGAARRGDEDAAAQALLAQRVLEAREVIAHQRLQGGVDRRRGCPRVLAEHRVDSVRERVGNAGQPLLDQLSHAQLVSGVDRRPEQADGDRLDLRGAEPIEDRRGPLLVERLDHVAAAADPLRQAMGEASRHERLRIGLGEVEGRAPPALAEDEDVLVPCGGEEAGARRLAGQHRVDRAGGGEGEVTAGEHLGEADLAPLGGQPKGVEDPSDRIVRGRRRLHQGHLAGDVLDHEVGEGPPGVDRESFDRRRAHRDALGGCASSRVMPSGSWK